MRRKKRTTKTLPPLHPGEVLREEFLVPMKLSPYAVARACGVPRTRIERIAREELGITADTALRLGRHSALSRSSGQSSKSLRSRDDGGGDQASTWPDSRCVRQQHDNRRGDNQKAARNIQRCWSACRRRSRTTNTASASCLRRARTGATAPACWWRRIAGVGAGCPTLLRGGRRRIAAGADEVFARADLIVKVKEPLPQERKKLRRGQILFTYLHLAPDRAQTEALIASGSPPSPTRRSPPAGHAAAADADVGGRWPDGPACGRALPGEGERRARRLLGGVPGVPPADVVILGGGVAGTMPRIGVGLGARSRWSTAIPMLCGASRPVRRARAHRVLDPRRRRGALPARRPGDRYGAGPGRGGAEADQRGDREGDEARRRDRRRRHRSGRLRGDFAADHAFATRPTWCTRSCTIA